jgi:hypothetical protein
MKENCASLIGMPITIRRRRKITSNIVKEPELRVFDFVEILVTAIGGDQNVIYHRYL